jgi:prepilin-type N-terminal cleavage/methylation domain-containing protein
MNRSTSCNQIRVAPYPGDRRATRPAGFTLVELLVVMAIIAIIAGFALGALFSAQQTARRASTQALVTRLHNQMAQRWDTYLTRRLPVVFVSTDLTGLTDPAVLVDFQRTQLRARRELMRMELPDQYDDLRFTPVALISPATGAPIRPASWLAYRRRINEVRKTGEDDDELYERISEQNESAECLYMVMTTGMGDETSGGDFFSQKDIGDTDGDGMLEFVDAWGNPIEWIRWPVGFIAPFGEASKIQGPEHADEDIAEHAAHDPDPFDPFRVDPNSFRIFPLIMSAGPDNEYGVYFIRKHASADYSEPFTQIDGHYRGEPNPGDFGGGHLDNIHNHSTRTRSR